MAKGVKISELVEATEINMDDFFVLVQKMNNKKISWNNMLKAIEQKVDTTVDEKDLYNLCVSRGYVGTKEQFIDDINRIISIEDVSGVKF